MPLTGVTQVAMLPGAAFYDDFEDTPMAPSTFSTTTNLPTNYPNLPNQALPVRGKTLAHGVQTSVYALFMCNPDVAGVTTFVTTLWLGLEPNAKNVDLTNHNARVDVTLGIITSATSLADDSALGTAVAATCTMGSAVGVVSTVTCSTTTGSITAGTLGLIRIRRLGTDALDTNLGRIVLLGASITAS